MPSRKPSHSLPIQQRDLEILRGLFESRIMTRSHVAILYFEGRAEAAKKRLQKLIVVGFIRTVTKRYGPSFVSLTRIGLLLLKQKGILAEYPPFSLSSLERRSQVADATIHHELEVLDVKTAICAAVRVKTNLSVAEFSTWPVLNQFTAHPNGETFSRTIRPDGYIHIREGNRYYRYFLEYDRSHEKQEILAQKCACYADYYRTGGFALRHGADRAEFQKFPFRVLIVLQNAERRNNTAERLLRLNPPIRTQVYLTTFSEVKSDPLGPIWIRPAEYGEAITGTRFDQVQDWHKHGYKKQSERERIVEERIRRIGMFEDQPES